MILIVQLINYFVILINKNFLFIFFVILFNYYVNYAFFIKIIIFIPILLSQNLNLITQYFFHLLNLINLYFITQLFETSQDIHDRHDLIFLFHLLIHYSIFQLLRISIMFLFYKYSFSIPTHSFSYSTLKSNFSFHHSTS
jgi:hypothetical protein